MKCLILLALLLAGACDDQACSKCRPGTGPSNAAAFCSPCIPLDGGVGDGGAD
jgi:hypothetical protein